MVTQSEKVWELLVNSIFQATRCSGL